MKFSKKAVLIVALITAAGVANAQETVPAIDTAAVTEGITAARTAILAVLGALTSLSVAIFGVAKVYGFIKRKAGA
jgi:hypothetical protein